MHDYIYHYTSIESLALILKNRTIKFNRLENVDDITETQFSDYYGRIFSQYMFISCWTDNSEENLAFWNMYTPNMKGVRIRLPSNLFEKYVFDTTNILGMSPHTLIHDSFVPKEEFYNDKYHIIAVQRLFCKVIYTNDQVFLNPKIFDIHNNEITGNINEIGKYKSKLWEFQSEIRFRIFIFPRKGIDNESLNLPEDLLKILNSNTPPPMNSYFLKINDLAFDKMQITLGPKCGTAEEAIIHSLLQTYNPLATYELNAFNGLIR